MYRIIYLEAEAGYKTFDSDSGAEIMKNELQLSEQKMHVICVVDYVKQAIRNKCFDFSNHTDSIDHMIFDPMYVSQF